MAEPSAGDAANTFALTAMYNSPANETFSISKALPPPSDDSVASRTKYLSELRARAVVAQEEINKELTARMEEDKAKQEVTQGGGKGKVDDAMDEENYGEEAQEEED